MNFKKLSRLLPLLSLPVVFLGLLTLSARAGRPLPGVLSRGLEARILTAPGGREALWIYFKDKGFKDAAAENRAVASLPGPGPSVRPARRHSPNSLDLPVAARYVKTIQEMGGTIRHTSRWLNAASVEIDLSRVDDVASLPFVRRIDFVRKSKRPGNPDLGPGLDDAGASLDKVSPANRSSDLSGESEPGTIQPMTSYPAEELLHYGPSFNQDNQIGIVALHRLGYTGAGVTLAMLDTGFRTNHPATLGRRVIAERDFVFHDNDVDNQPADNPSAWSHGTATWSNSAGFKPGALVGGAYEANIILAKTEDIRSETPVEEDNYVAALEWADSLGVDIVSASLAYLDFDGTANDYTYSDLDGNTCVTTVGVDIAVSRGITVVNAMGNSGPGVGTLNAPADADSVIAVGAVDSLGTIAGFSSRGPTFDARIKPEVVARGVKNFVAVAASNTYTSSNGTSFATPMTAGAATLVIEAHPSWTGFQVRQALMNTASHPGAPDNNTGWGLVNALAAANTAPKTPPHVSLPFALIAPSRGATLSTAVPQLRWERSLPPTGGDNITYRVLLSTNASLAPADTFPAGADTTWSPSSYLNPGTTYYWTVLAKNNAAWVRAAYMPSRFTIDATVDAGPIVSNVRDLRLLEAGPNPMGRAPARVTFQLPAVLSSGRYDLAVFDLAGRRLRHLEEGTWGPDARTAEIAWDGRDDSGTRVGNGVYFVSLEALGQRSTLKVTVSR